MKNMESLRRYGIFAVLLVLVIFFSVTSKNFLVPNNLLIIARQISMLGIASIGMAFVLLLGGIDLSIGSQITLVNIVAAWLMINGNIHPILACLAAILLSTLIGLTNGIIIAKLKMPPIIVTLSAMIMIEGIAYMISGGQPIFGFPPAFSVLGQGYISIIPIPVIIMIIIMMIGSFILNSTYFVDIFTQ